MKLNPYTHGGSLAIYGGGEGNNYISDVPVFLMPIVGFRFRAYTNEQTLRALKAQLRLASEIYNTLRWADKYFHQRDGKGLTLTELRQLALDLRKQDEEYQQLYSRYFNKSRIDIMRLGSAFSMG